jgi:DNA repair protein RadD
MLTLRPYQEKILDDLWNWFAQHSTGNPVIEASVGAGKSVLIAELCKRAIETYPGTRIVMAVHTKELCEQNLHKLVTLWPSAPAGVHSASMGRKDMGHDVLFTTIGSVHKKAHLMGRVDLLLVDECHLISPNEQTMYQRLITELLQYNPDMRVIGWTGTAFRGDGVWLTEDGLFTHVACRVTMSELLRDGYLAPLVTAPVRTRIETQGVTTRAGEFVVSSLARASDKQDLVQAACAELVTLAADRKKWLVFAVTVEHAKHIAEELEVTHGIPCSIVCAETPKMLRAMYIADFKAGRLRALVNVAVLTTGFDAPEVDCIALLRATRSPVLYVQIAGRGMRIADGKTDCLWLDFTDTTATLGPVDQIKGRSRPPKGKGLAPFKYCDECGNPNAVMATVCVACGHQFPELEAKAPHGVAASHAQVISDGGAIWRDVSHVKYAQHKKEGRPDSLRVEYWDGFQLVASEWVCIEHDGYARQNAMRWWHKRATSGTPGTVADAIALRDELRTPKKIQIRKSDGRYWEVIGYEFAGTESHDAGASKSLDVLPTDFTGMQHMRTHEGRDALRTLRASSPAGVHDAGRAV